MGYKPERISLLTAYECPKVINESIDSYAEQFWLKKHRTEKELILYHYTSGDGIKGIIDARSFWNSDVNYLNDPLELVYGKKIVMDSIDGYLKKLNDNRIKEAVNKIKKTISILNNYNTYVTSFSEYDNLLSQWERYASKGYGYNIGIQFCSESDSRTRAWYNMEELSFHNYLPCLRKVTYEIDEQYCLVEKCLDAIIEGIEKYLDGDSDVDPDWDDITSIATADIFFEFMYSFKSPSYKEEYEWRMIYTIDKVYKPEIRNYCVNNNLIKPHLNMYIYRVENDNYIFPLHSIKSGPMLPNEIANRSLKEFLKHSSICSIHSIKVNNEIKFG